MLRNVLVKQVIVDAIARMEMVSDSLDLWIVIAMAPEVVPLVAEALDPERNSEAVVMALGDVKSRTMSLGLGPLTRNTRTVANDDHLSVTLPEGKVVNIPYAAIYCTATTGSLADTLVWHRSTELGQDIAYLDMVEPEHGSPSFHGLSSPNRITYVAHSNSLKVNT
jgi:hypothetical protein